MENVIGYLQLLGALLGTWIINLIHSNISAATILGEGVSIVAQCFFLEFIIIILSLLYASRNFFSPF
jgi:hypothetical protein